MCVVSHAPRLFLQCLILVLLYSIVLYEKILCETGLMKHVVGAGDEIQLRFDSVVPLLCQHEGCVCNTTFAGRGQLHYGVYS